jgi:hypothetical protein
MSVSRPFIWRPEPRLDRRADQARLREPPEEVAAEQPLRKRHLARSDVRRLERPHCDDDLLSFDRAAVDLELERSVLPRSFRTSLISSMGRSNVSA